MKYKLIAEVNSNHPTEALSNLEDMTHFLDEIVNKFSFEKFIAEDDLPIVIEYFGPEDDFYDTEKDKRETHSRLSIATKKDDTYLCNNPLFNLASIVHSNQTGIAYVIRARAYYHLNKTYTYFLHDAVNSEHIFLDQHEIMSAETFNKLLDVLEDITDKDWYWDEAAGMFVCETHKSRKLRPSDVLATWIMHVNNETVPF